MLIVSLSMQTLGSNAEHLAKGAYPLFENCYLPVIAGSTFSLQSL